MAPVKPLLPKALCAQCDPARLDFETTAEVENQPGGTLDNAVEANVRNVVLRLRASEPLLAPLVKKGDLKVSGARYSLKEGTVVPVPVKKAPKTAR